MYVLWLCLLLVCVLFVCCRVGMIVVVVSVFIFECVCFVYVVFVVWESFVSLLLYVVFLRVVGVCAFRVSV